MSFHLSWNEKKGSTWHSTPCTAATPILWRIWRPAPYFNLQCILALPLLPLKEKKQELMIICNSEKRHKSQTPSFANWMPRSLQWLLPKTLGKLAPSRPQYGQPGCGSRAQTPGPEQELLSAWVCSSSTAGTLTDPGTASKIPICKAQKRSRSLEGFNTVSLYSCQSFTPFAWSLFCSLVQHGAGVASCTLFSLTGTGDDNRDCQSRTGRTSELKFTLSNGLKLCYRKYLSHWLINSWKWLRKQN